MDPYYRSIISIALGYFKFQGSKITVLGIENIPETGPMIVASNHLGFLDYAYNGYPLWKKRRRYIRFMAIKAAFHLPWGVGFLMRKLKHIPVDPNSIKPSLMKP